MVMDEALNRETRILLGDLLLQNTAFRIQIESLREELAKMGDELVKAQAPEPQPSEAEINLGPDNHPIRNRRRN